MATAEPRRHNRSWTPRDVKHMRSIARHKPSGRGKFSAREAAALLGRTPGAVKYKAMVEGISFRAINQPQGVQKRLARRNRRNATR